MNGRENDWRGYLPGNGISGLEIPAQIDDLSPEFLGHVIADIYPGTSVSGIEFVKILRYGDENVSTSDRAILRLNYVGAPPDLPGQVVVKMKRGDDNALAALYYTEVGFYRHLRSEVSIEAPRTVGAVFDPANARYCLLIEDLSQRNVSFPNALTGVTTKQVEGILDCLARLHAHYWDSPRFTGDLAAMQSHCSGRLYEHFRGRHPMVPERSMIDYPWKRDLLDQIGRSPAQLWAETLRAQAFQATLPQTIVHGDAHIGNTYLLPDDRGGLVDWQLTVRGAWVHDVNYLIITAFEPAFARTHEQDLLRYYLERLGQYGVAAPPHFDAAWRAYRMGPAWDLEVGWMTVPDFSYGFELSHACHQRTAAAYRDLETSRVIAGAA